MTGGGSTAARLSVSTTGSGCCLPSVSFLGLRVVTALYMMQNEESAYALHMHRSRACIAEITTGNVQSCISPSL